MIRILILPLALAVLAGCAGGAANTRAPEQTLARPADAPPPQRAIPPGLDPGEAALAEAEGLEVAPPPGATTGGADRDRIIVPGTRERPVNPIPGEDPRSDQERAAHVRAWDRCVTSQQRRVEDSLGLGGSPSPVMDTPEQFCRERLGMASRDAIPASWSPRR